MPEFEKWANTHTHVGGFITWPGCVTNEEHRIGCELTGVGRRFRSILMTPQRQEDERIEGERRAKKLEEGYEQKVKDYEKKMGDMMLHIRTRDRQFMVVEDKVRGLVSLGRDPVLW